jgi:hypothetical protein
MCKHCAKTYAHPSTVGKVGSSGTTSSMTRHLKDCGNYKRTTSTIKGSDLTARMEAGQTTLDDYDDGQDESQVDKTLKFFISGNVAFNQADNPHFHKLIEHCKHCNCRSKGPKVNRKSVRSRLSTVATDAKEDLMITLIENDSKVSLALDCWTSKNGYAFLGIILVTYIPLLLFISFPLCMLRADSDCSYYWALD